jgi:hypothetical protein
VGVAAVSLLAVHHFFLRDVENAEPVPTANSSGVTRSELVDFPGMSSAESSSSGVSVAPGQRAYGRDGTTYVGIYECTVKGQRVVSDRPCGAGATSRVIEVAPATAPLPPVSQYRPSSPPIDGSSARSSVRSSNAAPDNTSQCAAVDQEIENLNARMRQRYGSAEGEWLRAEWHRLHQRRYDLRCGR